MNLRVFCHETCNKRLKYEYVVETGLVEGVTQLGHTNSITVNRGFETLRQVFEL
jgi:hypothetical protein